MKRERWDEFNKVRYVSRIILVMLFLLASFLILKQCYKVIHDNENKANQYFDNYYQVVETEISGFEKISQVLFYNKDVKSFADSLKNNYNAYLTIPVSKMISLYEVLFNEGQYSIVLTNLQNEICVNSKGSLYLRELREELNLDNEKIKEIVNNNTKANLYFFDENKGIVTFVFAHNYGESGNLYCFVKSDIKELLVFEGFNIVDSDYYDGKSGKTATFETIKQRESLTIKGLVYEYKNQNDDFYQVIFLIVCAVVLIVLIFYNKKIIEVILNMLYRPIIRVSKNADDYTGQGESWEESVKRVVRNSELLISSLKGNSEFKKKTCLKNYMYKIEDYDLATLSEYDLEYLSGSCRLVLIDLVNEDNDYSIINEIKLGCDFETNLQNIISSQSIQGELVAVNELRYAYITNCCDDDEINNVFIKVLNFTEACNIKAFVSVGNSVDALKNISVSFRNAVDLCEKTKPISTKSIVFSGNTTDGALNFYFPMDLEIKLIDNVLSGKQDVVGDILKDLIYKNFYELSLDDDKIREFKIVMVGTINRIINMMNKNTADIFGDTNSVYLEIGGSGSKEELGQNIKRVFVILCSYNANRKETKQNKQANNIIRFIADNFDDVELSLKRTASEFYISENHVSRILKEETGKNYSEFLSDFRMKKAKELLKNTNMTVAKVAEKVGYAEIRSFNKMFKKYTGKTPSEYRLM